MAKEKLVNLLNHQEVRSWRTLMAAFQAVYSNLEKELGNEGLSVSRFQILFYLYFEGNHKATALSKKLLVTRANISMFLRRMEADGLIKYAFPSGQKRPEVLLTAKGVRFFEDLFPRHIGRVQNLVKPLSQQTLSELESLVHRISKMK